MKAEATEPTTNAWLRAGAYSDMSVYVTTGVPPMPRPDTKRQTPNMTTFVENPANTVITLNSSKLMSRTFFLPTLSATRPKNNAPRAMPQGASPPRIPASNGVTAHSSMSTESVPP